MKPLRTVEVAPWQRFGPAVLGTKSQQLHGSTFSRGFLLRPMTDRDAVFPSYEACVRWGEDPAMYLETIKSVAIGVDLATKKERGVAMTVVGWDGKRKIRLQPITGTLTSPQTAEQVAMLAAKYPPTVVAVENNAYQQALVDWLKELGKSGKQGYEFWAKVRGIYTGRNKTDENCGLPHMEVEFKNGGWLFPMPFGKEEHDALCRCDFCRERGEFLAYPNGTTDIVMATWFASSMLRAGNLGASGKTGNATAQPQGAQQPDRHALREQMRVDREKRRQESGRAAGRW